MKILKLISLLLDYPSQHIVENHELIVEMIQADRSIIKANKLLLLDFVNQRLSGELLDWQADYDGLFERGRSLSLLIYEHLHGESRDRGQAMVNLLKQYRAAGLNIGVKELPDYLPLFLEFVSTQGKDNAKGWLEDIAPILAVLLVRLEKRQCNYQALFACLLQLSGAQIDLDAIREQTKNEKRDDTNKALDKVWEEEAVTFGGDATNGGCPTATSKPSETQRRDQEVPIQFYDAANSKPSTGELRS